MQGATLLGVIHFLIELFVLLVAFGLAYRYWQGYSRRRQRGWLKASVGFAAIGVSGVIHSFTLTGDVYVWTVFVGRILGYALILWSLWDQRREAGWTMAAISITTLQRPLYVVTALVALGVTYLAYQRYQATQERGDRIYALAFAALLISEILFVLSVPGVYDLWWKLAHVMKLVGFAGLGVYLMKEMSPAMY
jgi:nicotinamide riboside transporter PnuC